MSAISEDQYCAGWLHGCEYALWADLSGSPTMGEKGWGISAEEKEELKLLHELAGGWVMFVAEKGGCVFVTTEEWVEHVRAR